MLMELKIGGRKKRARGEEGARSRDRAPSVALGPLAAAKTDLSRESDDHQVLTWMARLEHD
jgi:hypothetical protein